MRKRMWSRLKLFILTATPTAILYVLWLLSRRPKRRPQDALELPTDEQNQQIVPVIEVTDTDSQNEVAGGKLKSHKGPDKAAPDDAKLNSETEVVAVNLVSQTKVSNSTLQSVKPNDTVDCISQVEVATADSSKSRNQVNVVTLKSRADYIEPIPPDGLVEPEREVDDIDLNSQPKVNNISFWSTKENDEDESISRFQATNIDSTMLQNVSSDAIFKSQVDVVHTENKGKPESETYSRTKVNNTTLQTRREDVAVNVVLPFELAKPEVETSSIDINSQTDGCNATCEMLGLKGIQSATDTAIQQFETCIESETINRNVGDGCLLKEDGQNVEKVVQCSAVNTETFATHSELSPEGTSCISDRSQSHPSKPEDLEACDDICIKAALMENGISASSSYHQPELVTVGQVTENGLESLEHVKSVETRYLSNAVTGSENSESGGDYVSESGSETQDRYAVAVQSQLVDGTVESSSGEAEKSRVVYQFDFPSDLCGRLIGKQGRNVLSIREKSGADIVVKNKLTTTIFRVVVLEGTKRQVTLALRLIKSKFPESRFPNVNYTQSVPEELLPPTESIMQLNLPLGVRMDVIVSRVIAANHVFVQQPSHPTFPHLELQMQMMLQCYDGDAQTPYLPQPYEVGVVCVALIDSYWYRVQVISVYSEADECDVKLVDYGGYVRVPGTALKQIRRDFTTLPFQAIECYLFGVISPSDEEDFPPDAASVLVELVSGSILQAEAVAVEEDQVPYILLTKLNGSQSKFINREIVNRGVARWLEQ